MDNQDAQCSHLKVTYKKRVNKGVTSGWWSCDDCFTQFAPELAQQKAPEQDVQAALDDLEALWMQEGVYKSVTHATRGRYDRIRAALTQHPPTPTVGAQVDIEALTVLVSMMLCGN
ncbi:hypothetical protein LZD49_33640 [Dyadobacter sp. CY261]|uniref:hypothetical protein n=1 Tax=Dyadobacter sp. CY261 TaxID=2907203 RepID=UPI001F250BD2|nr:hypothetical protein [Dyadobacter sp. CY261]MCF0075471.1 hypothetical protein [Dyadobacter sp. CY261]